MSEPDTGKLFLDLEHARAAYPAVITREQAASIMNDVCWKNRGGDFDWRMFRKGSGNSVPLRDTFISADILVHVPSNQWFDVALSADFDGPMDRNWIPTCNLGGTNGTPLSGLVVPTGVIEEPQKPDEPQRPEHPSDLDQFAIDLIALYLKHKREPPTPDIIAVHRTNTGGLAAIDAQLTADDPAPVESQMDRIEAMIRDLASKPVSAGGFTPAMLAMVRPVLVPLLTDAFKDALEKVARVTVTPKKQP